MKVILLTDVKKVGKKDQIIEVSDGYAQNFLIAKKLAVQVTAKSREVLQNQQAEEAARQETLRKEAMELAEKLKSITLEFTVQSGKEGKMFGNISLKQVAKYMDKKMGGDGKLKSLLEYDWDEKSYKELFEFS